MNLSEYVQKTKQIFLPHVVDKFNVTPQEVTQELLKYSNWVFKDNLVIFDYNGSRPNWIEICDTKYVRGKTVPKDKFEMYCRYNDIKDQHASVYIHDNIWKAHHRQAGNVKCSKGYVSPTAIYLELDRDTYEESIEDAIKIRDNFEYPEFMRFWFSGNRSVHIEVDPRLFGWELITDIKNTTGYGNLYYNLAHKIAGDARHNNGITDPYFLTEQELTAMYEFTFGKKPKVDMQKARQQLEVIDPNIYNKNSLIRQPYSWHEKGEKQKTEITELRVYSDREIKPYLLHWTFDCYKTKRKQYNYDLDVVEQSEIIKYFSKIENFNITDADEDGWVNGLYNPLYTDSNPSLAINIKTGYVYDFGAIEHRYPFSEFKKRIDEKI